VAGLRADGHEVVRLVRGAAAGAAPGAGVVTSSWDPGSADGSLDAGVLSGTDAVVNLAGAGVAEGRWTDARKAEIRSSRVDGTHALATGLAGLAQPPAVLLSGSAIGWYGDAGGREVDESSPAGPGFLAGVVRDWEAAAEPARTAGIRVATLRTGIVLSGKGGTLGQLLLPFKLGLGMRLGPGSQYMSWISLADEVGAIRFLIDRPDVSGPVNLTAPAPVTNAEFSSVLASVLHRPALLRVPAVALRLGLGEVAGELLASARVLPRKLLGAGYQFQHADIRAALAWAILGS
jgi:uncharacterized protein (TIGR01777 family)